MAVALQSAWSCPAACSSRATDAVANRLDRRSFIARSALVGSALVTAPADLLLRPTSAPTPPSAAARGRAAPADRCAATATRSSAARSTAPTPAQRARSRAAGGRPTGPASAAGAARYYMDCHKPCGGCGCGGGGICSGGCNGTACGCGTGPVRPPQGGLHVVPLRQLQQPHRLHRADPVPGRHVHARRGRSSPAARAARCAPTTTPEPTTGPACTPPTPIIYPVAGDWNGDGKQGIGFLRQPHWGAGASGRPITTGTLGPITYGRQAGDLPVVGDWNGDGSDTHRHLPRRPRGTSATRRSPATIHHTLCGFGSPTDIPVVGDWNGDGTTASACSAGGQLVPQRRHRRSPAPRPRLPLRQQPATSPSWATGTATASTASACSAGARGT